MERSLNTFEAERERVVLAHELKLAISDTPIKVALSCSRETTRVERDIEARLGWLEGEGGRLIAEAGDLQSRGAPSHEVVWRSSLGAAAVGLIAGDTSWA